MKLKQVLLGGLLLTVGFTACTNEDLMDATVPSTPEEILSKAVSLGEDFSIVGNKGDASTRAIIKDDLSGSIWEKTDTVGGAWYAMTTDGGETGSFIDGSSKKLFSNHPFAFSKDLGGMTSVEFKANTNAFAGKYILYYPYDYKVAAVSASIPVEFDANPVMDCTVGKELEHVNKNLFAWCDAEFKTGGAQAGAFALKQAGNVIVLKLGANSSNIDRIENQKIEKIILESNNALYNKATIAVDENKSEYKKMAGKYVAGTAISTYILSLNNADTDYQITAAGKAGMTKKAMYLSMLPAKEDISTLTVSVIMSNGRMFKKELIKTTDADTFAKLVKSGQKVVLDIELDTEIASPGIYTAEQFNAALAKADGSAPISLEADITLPSLDFNKAGKTVTINGKVLTVKGDLTISNGSLIVTSTLNAEGKVTVAESGKLTASAGAAVNKIAGMLSVDGAADITASKVASITVSKASDLKLASAEVAGEFTIGRAASVSLTGVTLKGKTVNTGGNLTIATALTNKSAFSSIDGSIAATVALSNEGAISLNGTVVTGAGITNAAGATLDIAGSENLAISKITNAVKSATAAAGVVNVEMGTAETVLTTEIDNSGVFNIKKGNVTESGDNKITMAAGATIDIKKDGKLSLNSNNSDGTNIAGGIITIINNTNLALNSGNLGSNVEVATEITTGTTDDWGKLSIAGLTTVILNKDGLEIDATNAGKLNSLNLILKNNIKFTTSTGLTMTKALNVDGNVKATAAQAVTITLGDKASVTKNTINGTLTIGENVTLAGNSGKSVVNVKNGKVQTESDSKGTITETNIEYTFN